MRPDHIATGAGQKSGHCFTPRPDRTARLRQEIAAQAAADALDERRDPWPDAWFDIADPGDWGRCRRLWATVLIHCIKDMLGTDRYMARRNPGTVTRDSWLGTRDFFQVCDLAGFDGAAVLDRLRPMLADPVKRARFRERLGNQTHGGVN